MDYSRPPGDIAATAAVLFFLPKIELEVVANKVNSRTIEIRNLCGISGETITYGSNPNYSL